MQIKVLPTVAIMFYMIHVRQMALRFALLDMAILTSQLEIKQWGLSTDGTGNNPKTTVKFPISFGTCYAVIPVIGTESSYVSGVGESWTTYWSQNLTGFACEAYDGTYNAGKSFIAVGK